jgi:hypothetical protein
VDEVVSVVPYGPLGNKNKEVFKLFFGVVF